MDREETAKLFRRNLYNFQVGAGFSECELSRTIDKSDSYIQAISSGRNFPSFDAFFDICEATHRSPAEFFLEDPTVELLPGLKLDPARFSDEQLERIRRFAEAILQEGQ